MSEQNYRARVRDSLKPGFVQQVENTVGPGTPDTYYAFDSVSGWIELKFAAVVPGRRTTSVFKSLNRGLDVGQEAWLYQAYRHGKNAWVLGNIGGRHFLVPGALSYDFNVMTMKQFDRFRLELSDLRAVLRFYAPERTNDNQTSCTGESPRPGSVWYRRGRCDFRPLVEDILGHVGIPEEGEQGG